MQITKFLLLFCSFQRDVMLKGLINNLKRWVHWSNDVLVSPIMMYEYIYVSVYLLFALYLKYFIEILKIILIIA